MNILANPTSALETLEVIKRDGSKTKFNAEKIDYAISKAVTELNCSISRSKIQKIVDLIVNIINDRFKENIAIYEIQSIVEKILIDEKEFELSKAYINHRVNRDLQRSNAEDINFTINRLVSKDKTIVNENANKDSNVYNTWRDLTAGVVGKSIGLKMLPKHVKNAHQKGQIHYHDLDYHPMLPMTNCCLIDFESMLNNGFKIGNAIVEPPKSINTATAQIAQIIANVASSQYGGCSANRIDELLAPFAKLNYQKHLQEAQQYSIPNPEKFARDKTSKDIYDAMQSLEYEINTLFTSNGQTPFTTVNFGLGTSWIEREIQQSILNIRILGLGKEQRTAIFPKLTFTLKRGINLDKNDVNYDIKQLALKCQSERIYPDILNYEKIIEITGSFKTPMGCRSFLQSWIDENGNDVANGRMNLGVVTLNLPRIAIESQGEFHRFFEILNERLRVCKDALLFRIKRCCDAIPDNAPILFKYGAFGRRLRNDQNVNELYKNRRATVSLGYIGLYEVCALFFGSHWENNDDAIGFSIDILEILKKKTSEWSNELGYHFSVYATPSESLTDRFARIDREKFGTITDVTDKEYYTNSFHYDVRKKPTPFEKIDFEAPYSYYSSGGFIHYVELANIQHNLLALESLWDYAYNKIGYFGLNSPIDKCFSCGFTGEFDQNDECFYCPSCGNHSPETVDVVKRMCGYLGNPQQRPIIKGRAKEIASRKKHL